MSTLAYSKLTTMREDAEPGTSEKESPPGVTKYVDSLAALVPSEVLAVHAAIVAFSIKTEHDTAGNSIAVIVQRGPLQATFFILLLASFLLYLLPKPRPWGWLDLLRGLIPPAAFVGWTMVQRATAFDAVFPYVSDVTRNTIGVLLAFALGGLAAFLAGKADKKPAPSVAKSGTGAITAAPVGKR